MDEAKARGILDEALAQRRQLPTEPGEWAAVLDDPTLRERVDYSETPEEDFAGDAVAFIVFSRRLRDGARRRPRMQPARRVEPIAAPDWWEAESLRRLDFWRADRVEARIAAGFFKHKHWSMFGHVDDEDALAGRGEYAGLATVAEIEPLLLKLEKEQWERSGVNAWEYDTFDLWQYEEHVVYPAATWEDDRRIGGKVSYIPTGRHPDCSLEHLVRVTRWIAHGLHIPEQAALVWSLTDRPFTIPWMPVTWSEAGDQDGHSWATVTVQVNSISATARDVGRAYSLARREGGDDPQADRRAPRPWPTLVVGFVRQRRKDAPGETWAELFAAFADAYPDHHYKTMRTFASAYREKARDAKP